MKLIPLHDWLWIVRPEAGSRTAGGLFILDMAKEKPEEGVVEAPGPGLLKKRNEVGTDEKKSVSLSPRWPSPVTGAV
jgi:chaperonin GroES